MSIEKYEIDSFKKEHIPFEFTILPNLVLQNFTNEALGLWCHLMSLSSSWIVNREYLMNKFDIGRDKLDRWLKLLIDNYLLTYEKMRDSQGKITKVCITVKNGSDFYKNIVLHSTEKPTTLKNREKDLSSEVIPKTPVDKKHKFIKKQQHLSTTLKTHSVDYPLSGKTAPINNIYIQNNKKDKKDRESVGAKSAPLFAFIPSEENQMLAKDLRIDIDKELISFKEKHTGKKTQYEFERWLKLAREYQDNKRSRTNNEIKSTVMEWGPGHPGWESLHGKKDLNHANQGNGTAASGVRSDLMRSAASYLL